MKKYLKLFRIHHYIKNLLVLAALVCSGQISNADGRLLRGICGFIVFCILSSAVYIINDLKDVSQDRCHPEKCKRPIASGDISVQNAKLMAALLIIITFLCSILLFGVLPSLLLAIYLISNIAYSFGLKNKPIIDITILTSGFIIRVLFGAAITGINVSNWLLLTVASFAFYFALGKRRNELLHINSGKSRSVLKNYPIGFLDKNMYMCLCLANVFYALWSMDENTLLHYRNSNYLFFTVPLVFLISLKYSFNIEGETDGDPVEVLLHDKVLIMLCCIYIIIMFSIFYIM